MQRKRDERKVIECGSFPLRLGEGLPSFGTIAAQPFRIPERVTAPVHEGGTDFACDHARTILSPCSWLTAYWTGRYFGFLSESD